MTALRSILAMLALLLAAPAWAQTFPQPNNTRVVDAANVIDAAQEAALNTKLETFERQSGRQVVVATVPDLQGYPIEDYGYRLGRAWGIGDKEKDDGTILLVAPKERKVRIEVGYGANVYLTDLMSSLIVNTRIVPKFKQGDLVGGINSGIDAMIQQLSLTPEEAAKRNKELAAKKQGSSGADIGTIIFWLFIFFFVILPIIRPLFFRRGRRGRRYGSGPVIIWGGGGDWGGGGSSWGSGGDFGDGGGFSGGGGSFGGGGASGDW